MNSTVAALGPEVAAAGKKVTSLASTGPSFVASRFSECTVRALGGSGFGLLQTTVESSAQAAVPHAEEMTRGEAASHWLNKAMRAIKKSRRIS